MNRWKRIGCAALALILLTCFPITGTAAEFTDTGEIANREAVAALYELNIVKGKEDGSFFDPAAPVTRAELVKMICVALGGGAEPILGRYTPTYADTAGHWAKDYIEYGTRLGLVSGRGGGVFDPDAPVTGSECAKILLTALGYDAAAEGFLGVFWDIPVNFRAVEKDLYAGLECLTPSAPLTRDSAARMVYNALDAGMVEYEYQLVAVDGVLTTVAVAKDMIPVQTIIGARYQAFSARGILTGISGDRLSITADDRSGSTTAAYTGAGKDYSGLLGQYIRVFYKNGGRILGAAAAQENVTVTAAVNTMKNKNGKLEIGGSLYTLDNGVSGSITVLSDGTNLGSKTAAWFVNTASFDDVTLVDNDGDNQYEMAVIATRRPARVNYTTAAQVIAGGVAYSREDHVIAAGLQTGDYVAVTVDLYGQRSVLERILPLNGKVNGYRPADQHYLIDGVWYAAAGALPGIALGDTVQIISVNGVIFDAKKADDFTTDQVVMALAVDPPAVLERRAAVLKADGTREVVAIDRESAGAEIPVPGKLYTYTQTGRGCKFQQAATRTDYTYTAGPALAGSDGTVGTVNGTALLDSAVIFVWSAAESAGTVITGRQLCSLALNTAISPAGIGAFTTQVGGLDRIVLAAVSTGTDGLLPTVGNPTGLFGLIVQDAYQDSADTITYKLWDGSSVVTVREKHPAALAQRAQMSLVRYSAIREGIIQDVSAAGESRGALVGMIGDEVSFDGVNMKELTSDTVYLYYDSSAEGAGEIGRAGGTLTLADRVAGVPVENVKYVLDGGAVAMILLDVNNRLSDATEYSLALANASTRAQPVFRDASGNLLAPGDTLPAGAIVNVTVSTSQPGNVSLLFAGAVSLPNGLEEPYESGGSIALPAGGSVTKCFVVSGGASFTLRDGP